MKNFTYNKHAFSKDCQRVIDLFIIPHIDDAELLKAITAVAKDGSGIFSYDELSQISNGLINELSDEEIKTFVKTYNDQNVYNYKEMS